jgi:homoserine dehydrogenase
LVRLYTGCLQEGGEEIGRRLGASLEVVACAVREPGKKRSLPIPEGTVAAVPTDELLAQPEVDLIVEVMGGLEPARALVTRALRSRKPVVTANKALLAEHGLETVRAVRSTKDGDCLRGRGRRGGADRPDVASCRSRRTASTGSVAI